MSHKVWIEVAMNGAWTRALQPNIPVTAEEITREQHKMYRLIFHCQPCHQMGNKHACLLL